MAADEEPDDGAVGFDAEGAVVVIDADRPEGADALEVEGGMPMVLLPEGILLPGPRLHRRWKTIETGPEIRRDGGAEL